MPQMRPGGSSGDNTTTERPLTKHEVSEAAGWGMLKAIAVLAGVALLIPITRCSLAEYDKYAPGQSKKPDYQQLERDAEHAARAAAMEERQKFIAELRAKQAQADSGNAERQKK